MVLFFQTGAKNDKILLIRLLKYFNLLIYCYYYPSCRLTQIIDRVGCVSVEYDIFILIPNELYIKFLIQNDIYDQNTCINL